VRAAARASRRATSGSGTTEPCRGASSPACAATSGATSSRRLLVRLAGFYDVPASAPPHPRSCSCPSRRAPAPTRRPSSAPADRDPRGRGAGPSRSRRSCTRTPTSCSIASVARGSAALERVAAERGGRGREAWRLLHEALPTALAQAWPGNGFARDWSADDPWYHLEAVDAYAKRLFPLVRETLENGGRFDEAFVRRAVALHAGSPGTGYSRSP